MSFNVIPSDKFKKEAKRLIRKFPSLKDELRQLSKTLIENPETGKSLGNDTYKIRLAIKSKGKDKSGGARIITYLVTENEEVYLLLIYDKAEYENVDDKILQQIIDGLDLDRHDRT
jgi:mRNA-degrading endonuclease RelE of RelBE toxin-antitoxin system